MYPQILPPDEALRKFNAIYNGIKQFIGSPHQIKISTYDRELCDTYEIETLVNNPTAIHHVWLRDNKDVSRFEGFHFITGDDVYPDLTMGIIQHQHLHAKKYSSVIAENLRIPDIRRKFKYHRYDDNHLYLYHDDGETELLAIPYRLNRDDMYYEFMFNKQCICRYASEEVDLNEEGGIHIDFGEMARQLHLLLSAYPTVKKIHRDGFKLDSTGRGLYYRILDGIYICIEGGCLWDEYFFDEHRLNEIKEIASKINYNAKVEISRDDAPMVAARYIIEKKTSDRLRIDGVITIKARYDSANQEGETPSILRMATSHRTEDRKLTIVCQNDKNIKTNITLLEIANPEVEENLTQPIKQLSNTIYRLGTNAFCALPWYLRRFFIEDKNDPFREYYEYNVEYYNDTMVKITAINYHYRFKISIITTFDSEFCKDVIERSKIPFSLF